MMGKDLNTEYYKILINNYLSKQASDKDIGALMSWVEQSAENRKLFTEYKKIWELTMFTDSDNKFDKSKYKEWGKLSGILAGTKDTNNNKKIVFPFNSQRLLRIAAIGLLFISLGATIAWRVTSNRLNKFINREITHEIIVPKGSRSKVILPDSTQVWLNAGTILRYKGDFGFESRNIYLEGEGYFTIVKNPEIPFVVETFELKIKALGTIFNVKAYPEENSITTTLVEGIVKIEGKGVNLTLNPNQKITYFKTASKDSISSETIGERDVITDNISRKEYNITKLTSAKIGLASGVNTHDYTSWKDDRLVFNSEKLSNLSVMLERKFDVSIDIQSEELMNYKFTGTFYHETLEQVLNIINLTAPIKYQIKDGIVTIQLDKNRKAIYKEITNESIK